MIPTLSPPVKRSVLFTQDTVSALGEALVPSGFRWVPSTGRDNSSLVDPHDPGPFDGPVPGGQWCQLFSGSSFVACLAALRKR